MTEIQTPLEELGWDMTSDHTEAYIEDAPVKETLFVSGSNQIIVREVDNPSTSIKTSDPMPVKQ